MRPFESSVKIVHVAQLGGGGGGGGGGENPQKDGEHDHLIDALRYFFVNRGRGEVVQRKY